MNEEAEFKLTSILGEFFRDSFYKEAIINLRKSLAERNDYQKWEKVIRLIINRDLEAGEPLTFVQNTANLPLDENSDEEAYRWLTLMLINSMGAEDSPVIEY
jgi:hypothetical protein